MSLNIARIGIHPTIHAAPIIFSISFPVKKMPYLYKLLIFLIEFAVHKAATKNPTMIPIINPIIPVIIYIQPLSKTPVLAMQPYYRLVAKYLETNGLLCHSISIHWLLHSIPL